MTRGTPRVLAATAVAPVLFGTTYLLATSDWMPQHRPLLLATLRVLPAALVLLAVARPRLPWPVLRRVAAIGSFNMGLFFFAFFVAADRLPNGVAATVSNTTPLFVLAMSPLVLKERPATGRVLAGLAALAGVALLVGATPDGVSAVGVTAGLASAALLGLGFVCTRRWLRDVRPIDSVAVQLLTGGVLLAALALIMERRPVDIDAGLIGGAAILSLILTALPYVLLFDGIARIGPSRVALLSPITPVVATALGVGFRDERLTTSQAVGLVIVIGALVLAQRPGRIGPSARREGRCSAGYVRLSRGHARAGAHRVPPVD